MTEKNRKKKAAKSFAEYWKERGDEKSDSQAFWLSLIHDVLGIKEPEKFIFFEERVKLDHMSFIDVHIPSTHVLIEQKKKGQNLYSPIRQSDGTLLTPFQQAQRYSAALPYSKRPRWIITCNFEEFLIYDMEKPAGEPESILLKNLGKEYYRLQFLIEEKSELLHREEQLSVKAGYIVGKLYDAILKQYIDPKDKKSLHSLNILCVRLVFCLYAEDAGIFGEHMKFFNYIKRFDPRDVRRALIDLFRVLDTQLDDRDPYMDEELASFPYVNGGLFADENIEIPNFTQEIVDMLLHKASEDFDWSEISPTIFGAVFESTLNPETRRKGGMHYTSIENIHKVIDPLFLDELREELEKIKALKVPKIRKDKAEAFRIKLSKLTFLDPACGSGNFLTQTYISLRRLENGALKIINGDQIILDTGDIIKVSIGQFFGIEINDFAVTVAKTALWIAELQMIKETEEILNTNIDFLPLKSYANIVEGNALRIDWESVISKDKLNYIMGNPPFLGASKMAKNQKEDAKIVLSEWKNYGTLDYVSCWYKKAVDYILDTSIRCAYVSTNSICQGEQVANLWKPIFLSGVHIDFAYSSFRWNNETNTKAQVHCVIVGFSVAPNNKPKQLYFAERLYLVDNINFYLVAAPIIFIEGRPTPICDAPKMTKGSQSADGGNFIVSTEKRNKLLKKESSVSKWIRPYVGAKEFITNKKRWCLWLVGISPEELLKSRFIRDRVKKVHEFRVKSTRYDTLRSANTSALFQEIRQPTTPFLVIPEWSVKRQYIPIGYLNPDIICSNRLFLIPYAQNYHFGILTSSVHMAWVRTVCGRFGESYRYAIRIVYNNFPWPNPTDKQKLAIEKTAQAILDARALYPDCSLATLYNELTMPIELRKAHKANDKAVMQAYGFKENMSESDIVKELMKMYSALVAKEKDGEHIKLYC